MNMNKTIHIHMMTVLKVVVQRGKLVNGKEFSYSKVCPNTATDIASVSPVNKDQNFFQGVLLCR